MYVYGFFSSKTLKVCFPLFTVVKFDLIFPVKFTNFKFPKMSSSFHKSSFDDFYSSIKVFFVCCKFLFECHFDVTLCYCFQSDKRIFSFINKFYLAIILIRAFQFNFQGFDGTIIFQTFYYMNRRCTS